MNDALDFAVSQGIDLATVEYVWLDVETLNPWSDDAAVNQSALQGYIDAGHLRLAQAKGLSPQEIKNLGIYSNPRMWQQITGGQQNRLPVWVAAGDRPVAEALTFCLSKNFTGGTPEEGGGIIMIQIVHEGLDTDMPCI
jgi:hypothetical protein